MVICESCGAEYPTALAADRCCTDEQRPWDRDEWW